MTTSKPLYTVDGASFIERRFCWLSVLKIKTNRLRYLLTATVSSPSEQILAPPA